MAGLNIIDRVRSAVAGATSGWRFQGRGGSYGLWPSLMPSSNIDYAQAAGDPMQNTVVMSTLLWIMRAFPEAPIRMLQTTTAGDVPIINHRITNLIRNPNPYYGGNLLMQSTVASLNLAGNGYWYKMRNAMGVPVQLYYIPHFMIFPRWDENGDNFISAYEYRVDGQRIYLPVGDVVHFRNGLDPNNTRSGLSPLASALRDIFTDNEAANWTASILRNAAVPGIIISPSHPEGRIEDPDHVKNLMLQKFTADKRGEPLVLDGGVKVDVISFSPEEMNIRDLRRLPEERISALLGVPAMVVGLGAGLERSTFTNMTEARMMAYESNIVPTYRLMANEIDRDLVTEMGNPDVEHSDFDVSKVRVLQDDLGSMYQRNTVAVSGNWMKISEARAQAGLLVSPEDDQYLWQIVPATAELQAETAQKTAQATAQAALTANTGGGDRPSANDGVGKKLPTPAGR